MGKRMLINLIAETFSPFGFKRKGNYWLFRETEVTKVINLQKSNFGNYFYINYGFILNNLDRDGETAHIWQRLASSNKKEQLKLTDCLNLEYEMPEEDRSLFLKEIITEKVLKKIQGVNSELELVEYLKKRPQLNDISLKVKEYLNLT